MLIIRRKNMIVGLLVVLLIVTGFLNFWFNQKSKPTVNHESRKSSFDNMNQSHGQLKNQQEPRVDESDLDGKITVTDLEEPADSPGKEASAETNVSNRAAFFKDYRFERTQERSKEVEYINSVVNNPKSEPETVKEAQSQLLEITSNMEAELVIENLIKAKGIQDAIVIIHKDNVNVIVDKPELVPEEVAMILDIVKRETGKETDNIKIIPKI